MKIDNYDKKVDKELYGLMCEDFQEKVIKGEMTEKEFFKIWKGWEEYKPE
jgi:hypothetical protein